MQGLIWAKMSAQQSRGQFSPDWFATCNLNGKEAKCKGGSFLPEPEILVVLSFLNLMEERWGLGVGTIFYYLQRGYRGQSLLGVGALRGSWGEELLNLHNLLWFWRTGRPDRHCPWWLNSCRSQTRSSATTAWSLGLGVPPVDKALHLYLPWLLHRWLEAHMSHWCKCYLRKFMDLTNIRGAAEVRPAWVWLVG